MGLFDNLKSSLNQAVSNTANSATRNAASEIKHTATNAVTNAASHIGLKSETFQFNSLPQNLAEIQSLPEAEMKTPFQTAALAMTAFCRYGEDSQAGIEMLNFLKGPQPLSGHEISFLHDRYMDGKKYIPYSYFNGSSVQNNYTPAQPYVITVREDPHSNDEQNYCKLFVQSSGADSPRPIKMRRKGDGTWCLWEFSSILSGIRIPAANDPWA